MTDWTKEEDEAFNAVEQQSNLGKQILKAQGQPYHFDTYVSPSQRNHVLEEVALEFDKMPFGDTAQSFAAFVRNMKSCPPCHGNCYQGRTCPRRNKCLVSIATPQRTWVGLTDKEIEEIWKIAMFTDYGIGAELSNQPFVHYAKAIEAKLRSKNHEI